MIITIIIGGWTGLYLAADRLLVAMPADELLADSEPLIIFETRIPGARLLGAKLTLDGDDISEKVMHTAKGVEYVPLDPLTDGAHSIQVDLLYSFILRRRVTATKDFTIDTLAPHVDFAGYDGNIAVSRAKQIELKGSTEPRASVLLRMNGADLPSPDVDGAGLFGAQLTVADSDNELVVKVTDLAGNKTHLKIPVIIDSEPPQITEQVPPEDETYFSENPRLIVVSSDDRSAVVAATFILDGITLQPEFSEDRARVTYASDLLADGDHQASLKLTDNAGNKLEKEWAFRIDSTNLIIDLGKKTLDLRRERRSVKSYGIAIGMEAFPTPQGEWTVIRKKKEPTWYNPKRDWSKDMPDKIGPGAGNPLGTRALYLNAHGIRIHGTYQSLSIGQAASHGCIRMTISDSEKLYDQVPVGAPVKIF